MKDYRFGSKDGTKPSYYVFISAPRMQDESAFYHFDTPQEACALFNYLQVTHPEQSFTLGIHKDGTRRADISEQLGGNAVLSDDYKRISPWKDDPAVMQAAEEISRRIGASWKIDRELVGRPILIPNESELASYVPWYLDGKALRPSDPENLKTSIQELYVEGIGWMTLDGVRAMAKSRDHFNPVPPMVSEYLVTYQVGDKGVGGTMPVSPAEFAFMEKRYVTWQQELACEANCRPSAPRELALRSPEASPPFDSLKKEARERVLQKSQPYSPKHPPDHVHSL